MKPLRAVLTALCVVAGIGTLLAGAAVGNETLVWLGLAVYACAWGIALS